MKLRSLRVLLGFLEFLPHWHFFLALLTLVLGGVLATDSSDSSTSDFSAPTVSSLEFIKVSTATWIFLLALLLSWMRIIHLLESSSLVISFLPVTAEMRARLAARFPCSSALRLQFGEQIFIIQSG